MNKLFCSLIITSLMLISIESSAKSPQISVETILSRDHTILGQPFVYPEGQANITAAIITVKPHRCHCLSLSSRAVLQSLTMTSVKLNTAQAMHSLRHSIGHIGRETVVEEW